MQNEITELRNQVRTLKRIACLVCCLFAGACFTGCQSDSCVTEIQNRIKKNLPILNETDLIRKPTLRDGGPHGPLPPTPYQSHMPGGHPPWSTWVVMKKDVGSGSQPSPGSQPPPLFKIIANWYPEYPSSHPKEMYLLLERGGVYTMNYWHDPKQDHTGNYWLHPVTVESLKPITSYMDLNKESRLKITLIDPNTEPEQISPFRPNGDFWKTNIYGNLEIWDSGGVVKTIPNLKNHLKSD